MKKAVYVIIINLIILACIVGFLEISIRILYPEIKFPGTDKQLIQENVYGTTPGLNPNSDGISNGVLKKVDESGFWKYSHPQRNNTPSILFIGDSVTMGIGVESDSTFGGIIHNSLDSISVLNPALIGYSNQDYLKIVSKILVPEVQNSNLPQSIYLFWCLNDVYSNELSTIGFNSNSFWDRTIAFFRNHSKLYHFLKATVTDRPKRYYQHDQKFYIETDPNFQRAIRNITTIDSIAADHQVPVTVVLLPYEYQLRKNNTEVLSPNDILKETLSDNGIRYLDLTSPLRETEVTSDELYLYGDGIHFSDLGHKLIAEELLKTLN